MRPNCVSAKYYRAQNEDSVYRMVGHVAERYDFSTGKWEFSEDLYELVDNPEALIEVDFGAAFDFIRTREEELSRGITYSKNSRDAYPKEMWTSEKAGCPYCLRIFPVDEVKDFIREQDGRMTPQCPYCGVDALHFDKAKSDDPGWLSESLLRSVHEALFG